MANNNHLTDRFFHRRLLVLIGVTGFFFLIVVIRLFVLQVVNQAQYNRRSDNLIFREIRISALRGDILDRNNTLLATNRNSFSVKIIPADVPSGQMEDVLTNLSYALDIPLETIHKKVPPSMYRSYSPIEIVSGIGLSDIMVVAEHGDLYPGVSWDNHAIRNYQNVGSLFHVIGYINNINQNELRFLYNQGYRSYSQIGKSGVEKEYDMLLKGTDGKRFQSVDARGRTIVGEQIANIPPETGNTLVLTVDRRIQKLCEHALGERTGSIIVMKPATGEILAMTSYPWIDPNVFYQNDNQSKLSAYYNDRKNPFFNRSISAVYPPASTFKAVMAAMILEEDLVPESYTVNCTGRVFIGDRYFHCEKRSGHGRLNLHSAISESCNVYFYTIANEFSDISMIAEYAGLFALGEKSFIDLPEEASGTLPTPEWKLRQYSRRWIGGDTVNMAIGQGYLTVTPLQMANAYAMILNDGKIYKPHVLKAVRDSESGRIISETKPEVIHSVDFSPDTFQKIRSALRETCVSGTAKNVLTTKLVQVAGKTGTGQVAGVSDNYASWFISYAPYDAPPEEQVVVVVLIEPQADKEYQWWTPFAANIIYQGIFGNQNFYEAVTALRWQWLFPDLEKYKDE